MSSVLDVDREERQIKLVTQTIFHHILRDYIAHVNEQEVMTNLYNFFKDGDIIIISRPEYRMYQELQKHVLNVDILLENKNG